MADQQYDVSKKFLRLFREKQAYRQKLRDYYLKHTTSPHPECVLEVDPAVVRYHAMLQYRGHMVKPNAKNVWYFLVGTVLPVAWGTWFFRSSDIEREKKFRSGTIAYKDRRDRQFY